MRGDSFGGLPRNFRWGVCPPESSAATQAAIRRGWRPAADSRDTRRARARASHEGPVAPAIPARRCRWRLAPRKIPGTTRTPAPRVRSTRRPEPDRARAPDPGVFERAALGDPPTGSRRGRSDFRSDAHSVLLYGAARSRHGPPVFSPQRGVLVALQRHLDLVELPGFDARPALPLRTVVEP